MMTDSTDAACGVDVVRCLYLAQVAEREGHPQAAGRWRKKAERWLETKMSGTALAAGLPLTTYPPPTTGG